MELQIRDNSLNMKQELKLFKQYENLEKLIAELDKRDIPESFTHVFNQHIEEINNFRGNNKALLKKIKKTMRKMLKLLEKETKLVPRNYYRHTWMALGMSIFGVPLGLLFGVAIDNMGLMGAGISVGMGIGIALGSHMDKTAFAEGRQLDVDYDL